MSKKEFIKLYCGWSGGGRYVNVVIHSGLFYISRNETKYLPFIVDNEKLILVSNERNSNII